MLTNTPKCHLNGPHSGLVHQYEAQFIAELDGRRVDGAPKEVAFICEGCYPDKDDPTFSQCVCLLCLGRRK